MIGVLIYTMPTFFVFRFDAETDSDRNGAGLDGRRPAVVQTAGTDDVNSRVFFFFFAQNKNVNVKREKYNIIYIY